MKRMLSFLAIAVFGILGPSYLYLGFRLADSGVEWLLLAIPFLTILSMPVIHLSGLDRSAPLSEAISHAIFFCMGLVTYIAVFTVLRDFAWILLRVSGFEAAQYAPNDMLPARVVVAFAGLALAIGTFRAARGPMVKRIKIVSENLPQALDGFKIAQISDLHIGQTIRRKYVERLVEKVDSVNADIVAMTGDIGDGSVQSYATEISILGKMKSKHGIFYVPGNHEYYWSVGEWMGAMNSFGANVLVNRGQHVTLNGVDLFVAGIADPAAPGSAQAPRPDVRSAASGGSGAQFRILLSHRPGYAREASDLGFDLQLSGHTHGGQFFPWTVVVRLVHEFSLGLYRVGHMWLYVSGGTGSWGPLLRIGTTPELSVLELTRVR
ncbi:MAG TPA: metallophosphoesterase [Bdellovibrionales bacterium]|nr:metallophosphoesterase [Bdellovibrionales bacterium]